MNFESLVPTAMSIGGGFFIGILLGYFLKKVIKIIIFAAGGIIALLLYFQQVHIISVNIVKLEGSLTFLLNLVASSFDKMTQTGDMATLGIPLAGGLSAGLVVGFMKG